MFSLQHAIDEIVLQLAEVPAAKQPILVAELATHRAYQIITEDRPYNGQPLGPLRDALTAGALARLKQMHASGSSMGSS